MQYDIPSHPTTMASKAYLEIFIGSMFSGKTSKLTEIYKQCIFCSIPVAVINYANDKRYHDTMMSTHDKNMIPCIQTMLLASIWEKGTDVDVDSENIARHYKELRDADVILINEGQFFKDLYPIVESMLNAGKKIYIAGLDGDFQRKKFGQILDLIPLCDKVTKLTSLCIMCKNGESGIFSMRLTSETEQTLIGTNEYAPVCRKCFKST
jgi:thymidine kinase